LCVDCSHAEFAQEHATRRGIGIRDVRFLKDVQQHLIDDVVRVGLGNIDGRFAGLGRLSPTAVVPHAAPVDQGVVQRRFQLHQSRLHGL
jgi:hypothetical protein